MHYRSGNQLLFFCGMMLFALLLVTSHAQAVGVRPMVIDLHLKPGEIRDFELILNPGGTEETVDLSLFQPVQLITGALAYQQPVHQAFSAIDWVTLDANQVNVYLGKETRVTGTVQVPFSAGGSHTVVIMVEPQAPTAQQGVTFQVRYAVRLNIRVDRPGLRQIAEIMEFGLQSGDEGEPIMRAVVNNPSAWDYPVSGEVTIRDQERRLVERIALQSPANAGSGVEITRLYPGSTVEFLGQITKRLSPGEYSLRAYFRYGDQGQILRNEDLIITEGDFNFPTADEIGAFSLHPTTINEAARAGESKSQVLEFTSEIGESAQIVVEAHPISDKYPFCLVDWIQLRMSTNEFELPGRRTTRLGLTLAVPRDIEDGSYHGLIVAKAYCVATGKLLSEKSLPISILIGNNHQATVEVRSLLGIALEENRAELVLDIHNTGNVPLRPQASIILSDEQGQFVSRGILALPEAKSEVIPLTSQHLEAEISDLKPGVYLAQISIEHDGNTIHQFEQELKIP